MSENNNLIYCQRNREKILNKAKDKYKNLSEEDKIKRREYARDKYRNLSEEDKNKAREYAKNRYHNMSKEDKNKAREYAKIDVIICPKKIKIKQRINIKTYL